MTRIVLIAPRQGLVVHTGMDVFTNESVRKIEEFCKVKEAEYGEIERIILSMGTVRIMDSKEKIPVPLASGKNGTYGGF